YKCMRFFLRYSKVLRAQSWNIFTTLNMVYMICASKSDFSGKIIAKLENNIITYDPELQDHLLLDDQTGDLTITNILKHLSGVYCVRLMYNKDPHIMIQYEVHVYSPVSAPKLLFEKHISDSTKSWSCRVNCSVRNLSLSWFRGTVQLKNMSSVELARLSLPLELGLGETSKYICEAQNPMEKQSMNFDPNQLCLKNGGKYQLFIYLFFFILYLLGTMLFIASTVYLRCFQHCCCCFQHYVSNILLSLICS
uniref:Ig-like domain-containing protein n=1 Tax=Periophthalmus magnuspinnatus TaxID=409849 RepID=A0A3B3ZXG1_9GOBI